jgi:hypothetical protein
MKFCKMRASGNVRQILGGNCGGETSTSIGYTLVLQQYCRESATWSGRSRAAPLKRIRRSTAASRSEMPFEAEVLRI